MKKIIALMLSLLMLCSLAACNDKEDDKAGGWDRLTEEHTDIDGVTIQITDLTVEDGKVILKTKWKNDTIYKVVYGASYTIEREEDGEWVSTQTVDELYFISIAYELRAKSSQDKDYTISNSFDISTPGKYRIRSDCHVYNKGMGSESTKCELWTEFTVSEIMHLDAGEKTEQTDILFEAQYIRTNGYHEDAEYPFHTVIRSASELTAYYDAYKDKYDLGRKEKVYSDTTIGFLDACDKYDEAFFSEKALVLVVIEEGSGSIRHEVTGVSEADEKLHVYIESIIPEEGTDDMAEWHIIVAVDQDDLPSDDGIEIHYNEDKPKNVSYSKGYGSISMVLPKGWKYEIVDEDGVEFGIDIWPEGEIEGEIYVSFYNGFGVCGTGLAQETVTVAGHEAWQGTYDNAKWWDFIHLKDTPGDYVILNQGADAWLGEYEKELTQILDSLRIADNIITKEEALKIADLKATIKYDSTGIGFDVSKGVWCVTLYTQGVAGGNQDIEINVDGNVVNTTYGE